MKTEWTKKSKNIKIENEEHPTTERLFLEKSGVYSEFAKVVCIGFGSFQLQNDVWKMRLKSIAADDEKELLKSFAEVVNRFVTFNPQMSFCGHNIKEFDLPFFVQEDVHQLPADTRCNEPEWKEAMGKPAPGYAGIVEIRGL